MNNNDNLNNARKIKNDEFYTQYNKMNEQLLDKQVDMIEKTYKVLTDYLFIESNLKEFCFDYSSFLRMKNKSLLDSKYKPRLEEYIDWLLSYSLKFDDAIITFFGDTTGYELRWDIYDAIDSKLRDNFNKYLKEYDERENN